MKKLLAFLLDFARTRTGRNADPFHDDTLRANQPDDRTRSFSYWRALVS
jgi:hypothetical protein